MKENDSDEFLPEMSDSEKYEVEQMMIDRAFDNSYLVLTNKASMEDLLEEKSKFGMKGIMMFNPGEEPDEDLFDDVIYYYEDLEEYERCAELLKIKNKKFKYV
jgi:hypothetical protein|tara:strand:- start:233 stop:541 length:309 start_codon:yes stop_codon:yes gene_type:complete